MAPPSALIGDPPLSNDDLDIIKGFQHLFIAAARVDKATPKLPPLPPPEQGFPFGAIRPPPGQYRIETRVSNYTAAASITIIVMVLFTGSRLALRAQNAKRLMGGDDVAITIGTVGTAKPN